MALAGVAVVVGAGVFVLGVGTAAGMGVFALEAVTGAFEREVLGIGVLPLAIEPWPLT